MRSSHLLCFGLLLAALCSPVSAQRGKPATHPVLPGNATIPPEGKELFTSLCVNCHDATGKGDGPTARFLKTAPADLTQLSRHNNGVFPDERVVKILKGELILNAHGAQEMPTWGPTLRPQGPDGMMRLYSLVLYLAELQPPVVPAGSELFATYCVSCHGETARGNGRTAPWLKTPPPDLTQLAHANHGVFPEKRVASILKGDTILRSSGVQEMPNWEPTFRHIGEDVRGSEARMTAVVQFVAQLQAR